ncbi:YaaC family protein [Labrys neptuniae]
MDTGLNPRLAILREKVEMSIISPLKHHGWTASIEREVLEGEYLIVKAERGGHVRTCGILYSCATDNRIYKSLESQVGAIFFQGQPYHLESYAYGIQKPVRSMDDFQLTIIEWNKESSDGKFAPDAPDLADAEDEEPSADKHRLLLSEMPIEAIWLRLRQFQSIKLSIKLIEDRLRRAGASLPQDIVSGKAQGVAYAFRNASDYYAASQTRNLSQRILNLYYGTMAFAYAEMLALPGGASSLADIERITSQGHGLYTIEGSTHDLHDLVVGIIRSGFFTSWMTSTGMDMSWTPDSKAKTYTAVLSKPIDTWLTMEQLFARIPEVSDLYIEIFDSPTLWLHPNYDTVANRGARGLSSMSETPESTYGTFTDLSGRLSKEDVAKFPGPIREIRQVKSSGRHRSFKAVVDHSGKNVWWEALNIHTSPLGRQAIILPLFGRITQYRAICFVLLYALSIIVRYRPSVWRRVQEGDLDHMRVLIEAVLSVIERILPQEFLASVTGMKIHTKQPGSFF